MCAYICIYVARIAISEILGKYALLPRAYQGRTSKTSEYNKRANERERERDAVGLYSNLKVNYALAACAFIYKNQFSNNCFIWRMKMAQK